MTQALYPNAQSYSALLEVYDPEGQYVGDALSVVQPGGEFNDGTIVYVASELTNMDDREALLDQILKAVYQTLKDGRGELIARMDHNYRF